jgi:hypothetical protein
MTALRFQLSVLSSLRGSAGKHGQFLRLEYPLLAKDARNGAPTFLQGGFSYERNIFLATNRALAGRSPSLRMK